MNEYLEMWKHYADFSGKTTVKGYWMAVLINIIIGGILGALSNVAGFFSILASLYSLAVLVPGLAICVRRLRDAGKAWYNIFWTLLPIAGPIVLIVFLCGKSTEA